ncbi:ABC transporter ATP-binding protein [Methanobacterium subterraneum]|jgi:putative ABC transport system ATP-binding protein|uniref:ABC transporter ATP-binding protein n=1 Tax=Methanobacterium subterraneum TaxID=59277 RepID=A0A7K4DLE8_9EURY|nr:ABC transporter ATP-binding protein [Methanobacterium subterraneum]MBW4256125.1 ABC transporter ATP-binding protein [Methanobacterium sp. YSL]NMO09297.1 ABC transporter ATP-binding protein [Methanobacterium subterraneum]
MNNHVLEFKDVWKTYPMGDVHVNALAGLNLTLEEGSFTAVMGPSGSGKSTFLNVAGILDTPSRGLFRINGRQTSELSLKEQALLRRNEIGFVFQRFNLLSQLSALENVMLPMIHKDSEKAMGVLDKMGLDGKYHKRPTQLSGGEQQRVAISRALINDPSLILADEPTGELDTGNAQSIMHILQDLNRDDGVSIVVVTHNPASASFADEIIKMRDGVVIK